MPALAAELAALPIDGGDVDDAAKAALQHPLPKLAGNVEHRVQVDVDYRFPLGLFHALEGLVARDAGTVDQHIYGAHALEDFANHALAILKG